jgi:hypothetical protein
VSTAVMLEAAVVVSTVAMMVMVMMMIECSPVTLHRRSTVSF